MRGRPRKPVELHVIAGTHRADRHGPPPSKDEATPVGDCPARLGPEIAAAWDYLAADAAPGVLQKSDRAVLSLTAALLAKFWRSPLTFGATELARLHALLASMGMTPADRRRVVVTRPPAGPSPFARFRE